MNTEEITKELERGVKDLLASDKYKEYLDFMGKFHDYSVNNSILIFLQMHEFNWTSFRPVSVFDISQTDGDALPEICNDLTGSVDGYKDLIDRLVRIAPVPVSFEPIKSAAKGYFSEAENKIVVKAEMSEEQTVKTLVHEIAHSLLHGDGGEEKEAGRRTKEVQAESVAYTVCRMLGVNTDDYSFGYIAGWSEGQELKELNKSMETIRKTANKIMEGIKNEN